jgi:hypothetical protein
MMNQVKEVQSLADYNILIFQMRGKPDKLSFINTMTQLMSEMRKSEKVNICFEISSLASIEFDYLWRSLKASFASLTDYLSHIDKVAVVTNRKWIDRVSAFEVKSLPKVEEKVFAFEEKEGALNWLKEA